MPQDSGAKLGAFCTLASKEGLGTPEVLSCFALISSSNESISRRPGPRCLGLRGCHFFHVSTKSLRFKHRIVSSDSSKLPATRTLPSVLKLVLRVLLKYTAAARDLNCLKSSPAMPGYRPGWAFDHEAGATQSYFSSNNKCCFMLGWSIIFCEGDQHMTEETSHLVLATSLCNFGVF